jgi:hypothetical protein
MIVARSLLLAGIILLYGWLFTLQEHRAEERNVSLDMALPSTFYTITSGYMKQLVAEMLFIKTSVFMGGVRPDTSPTVYAEALGNNFETMTRIYPHFIDPYYFCQGFLPYISPETAAKANTILERGITTYPNDLILRFFYASNFFLAMNEPLKGAKAFAEAAKLPKAPPLFGHLASLLAAQGGDLAAGLISLKTMLAAEKDEIVRNRYEKEIVIFEQALEVQKALNAFTHKHGNAPATLEQLTPEFIASIPDIKDLFVLVYNPPTLHLRRPDRKKKVEPGT